MLGSDLDEIAGDGVQQRTQEMVHIYVDKKAGRMRTSKIFQSGEDESEVVNCFYTERSESEAMRRGDIQEQDVADGATSKRIADLLIARIIASPFNITARASRGFTGR